MTIALAVDGLSRSFGGLKAVNKVSFAVEQNAIFGIIGPNGAGKTTLFNLIAGLLRSSEGSVSCWGKPIRGMSADAVARQGVIRTFQASTCFKAETVRENLRRGALFGKVARPGLLMAFGALRAIRATAETKVDEVLAFTGLTDHAETPAGDLPYGRQKILGVGMAVAASPRMMLMDEPAAGLNPVETNEMGQLIARLRSELGITVVLVEHDMKMVMGLCDQILVLNYGQVMKIGTAAEVRSDPAVIEAYLGADLERA